jgi:hypothetical protein
MQLASYGAEEVGTDLALLEMLAGGIWQVEKERLVTALGAHGAGAEVPAADLRSAEEGFRRQRALLAADDLAVWLQARGLGLPDLRAHLRLGLVGAKTAAVPTPLVAVPDTDVRDAALRAALLEGWLGDAARRLVMGAAAVEVGWAPATEPSEEEALSLAEGAARDRALPLSTDDAVALVALAARALSLRAALANAYLQLPERDVEDILQENWADWAQLEYSEVTLPTEGAAREAVLCVRDDHLALEDVAQMASAPLRRVECRAVEVPSSLGAELLTGEPGSAIGPVRGREGWSVAVLHRRRATGVEDPEAWARAQDIGVRRRLERRLAGRVRWYAAAL